MREKAKMIYYYFKDDKGEWRWFLKAGNGRLIAASGEAYEEEQECLYDIELVKGSTSSLVKKQERGSAQRI
ncbi:MAG: YegP family protein [Pyrinomonadaceae bacterium]